MKRISLFLAITSVFFISQTKAQHTISSRPASPAKTETRTLTCPPGYIWKGNEWKWNKQTSAYEWEPGNCIRLKKGHIWLPGQWTRIAKGWMWTPGKWRRI